MHAFTQNNPFRMQRREMLVNGANDLLVRVRSGYFEDPWMSLEDAFMRLTRDAVEYRTEALLEPVEAAA